ncbi:hypothetical protein [Ornithinicoccus halotolerans]|uniref:hypothetical protein n=1 Tax=Ornithinicoccus halotolerans TaxID=1748220 RepID=UPI001294F7C5|nr:hypothetical protein [Ornithinicoccus halotolerans]
MRLTIDCQTCPARGHHCGDCFVPVLGRAWVEQDARAPDPDRTAGAGLALDAGEEAAVRVLLRGGLVTEAEAGRARARPEPVLPRLHAAG